MPPPGTITPPDPQLQIGPYDLYRALAEGRSPCLLDLRPPGDFARCHLRGTRSVAADPAALHAAAAAGALGAATRVVLIDRDDEQTTSLARALGRPFLALYGGMDLWPLAIVAAVVGETFLDGETGLTGEANAERPPAPGTRA